MPKQKMPKELKDLRMYLFAAKRNADALWDDATYDLPMGEVRAALQRAVIFVEEYTEAVMGVNDAESDD